MYRDNTLVPREAVRLLALGILATREISYAELAAEVRHFTSHVVGPSLDLVGSPIELLKVEGLIEPLDGEDGSDDAHLEITDSGREELHRLLASNVRAPVNDINKLILALKMRFLHLLAPREQALQIDAIAEMSERELVRLVQLRADHAGDPGHLTDWLDHDIAELRGRLGWFETLRARLPSD